MRLSNKELEFEISDEHGNLIWAKINGVGCAVESFDAYIVRGEDQRASSEASDVIVERLEESDRRIRLVCRNEETGLTLEKDYRLAPNDPMLRKRVVLEPGQFRGWLRLSSVNGTTVKHNLFY